MNNPTWMDGLRLLSVIGLSYGAWQGWRNRPPSFQHEGRKYYRLADGRFSNGWGKIVTEVGRNTALEAGWARQVCERKATGTDTPAPE